MPARLERSTTNKVIAGVCGGIAEYLAVDATLVRVVFVVGTFLTAGLGILAYIVLLILMPLSGRPAPFVATPRSGEGPTDVSTPPADPATASPATQDPAARAAETERRRMAFGYLLIVLGVALFLGNAGAFRFIQWQLVWPLVLVAIGALLLLQRMRP